MKTKVLFAMAILSGFTSQVSRANSCGCESSDTTYASCLNRLGKTWEVLYNDGSEAQRIAAKAYLDSWNDQGLGSMADARPYYDKYSTCDILPDGRRAIFYFFNGSGDGL